MDRDCLLNLAFLSAYAELVDMAETVLIIRKFESKKTINLKWKTVCQSVNINKLL